MKMEPLDEKLHLHVKDAKTSNRDFHHGFLVDHRAVVLGVAVVVAEVVAVEEDLVDTLHDEEVEDTWNAVVVGRFLAQGNVVVVDHSRILEAEEDRVAAGCYCT